MDRTTLLQLLSSIAFTLQADKNKDRKITMVEVILFSICACLSEGNESDLYQIAKLCHKLGKEYLAQTGS